MLWLFLDLCSTGLSCLNNKSAAGLLVRTDLVYNHVQFAHGLIYRCACCACQCSLALMLPVLLCSSAAWHATWLAIKQCVVGMLAQQCSSFPPNELQVSSSKQSPSFTRKGGEGGGRGITQETALSWWLVFKQLFGTQNLTVLQRNVPWAVYIYPKTAWR